jgi:hypothetical protein
MVQIQGFTRQTPVRRSTEFYLGLWTLAFFAVAALLTIIQPFASPKAEAVRPLTLKAIDLDERIRVDWDARHPTVRSADAAVLEVQDGAAFHRYPVEGKVLHSGGFDYVRKSPDVLLTLTLYQQGKPGIQSTARTIGAVQDSAVSTDQARARSR